MIGYYVRKQNLSATIYSLLLLFASTVANADEAIDAAMKAKLKFMETMQNQIFHHELIVAREMLSLEQDRGDPRKQIEWLDSKKILEKSQREYARFLETEKETKWPSFLKFPNSVEIKKFSEAGLQYLIDNHKEASTYSSTEWKTLHKLYGEEVYARFVEASFVSKNLEEKYHPRFADDKIFELVIVSMPMSKELFIKHKTKKEFHGHPLSEFVVSPYSSREEQAEELSHFLQRREGTEQQLVLISSEETSGIIRKYFDLHPGSRKHPLIKAWISFNGKFFGEKLPESVYAKLQKKMQRAPASSAPITNNPQEVEALNTIAKNQIDRALRQLKLSDGFPIYNLITNTKNKDTDYHETFLNSGENFLVSKNNGEESLEKILSSWIKTVREPASRLEKIHH